ncbi:hypothetical protein [Flagellimonas sp. 2504JD4-2]
MQQPANQLTPGGFVRTLAIVHFGLIAGPLFFGIVVYYLAPSGVFSIQDTDDMFLIVVPIFAITSVFLGDFIFKQSIKNIPRTSTLKQKLIRFQTASIIKYALVEAASFFSIIAFYQTNNLAFLLIAALLILYFYMLRPTKEKIVRSLNLSTQDRDLFHRFNQPLEE